MYRHIHVQTHTCTDVYIYIHVDTYMYRRIHLYTCRHIHVQTYTSIYMYRHIHVQTYTSIYMYRRIHLYTCTDVYIYIHVQTHTSIYMYRRIHLHNMPYMPMRNTLIYSTWFYTGIAFLVFTSCKMTGKNKGTIKCMIFHYLYWFPRLTVSSMASYKSVNIWNSNIFCFVFIVDLPI